jgi:hypothetical protein
MANSKPKLKDLKPTTVYDALSAARAADRASRAARTVRAIQMGRRGYGKRR